MARYIAFLRAINVGGHNIKMDHLRQFFESLGFSNVETIIASGNVILDAKAGNVKALEKKIKNKLQEALGYEVATFIRTDIELAGISKYSSSPQSYLDAASALNIGFLADTLDDTSVQKLMALQTDIDAFHFHRRETYWLCKKSKVTPKFLMPSLKKYLV